VNGVAGSHLEMVGISDSHSVSDLATFFLTTESTTPISYFSARIHSDNQKIQMKALAL
jgi:hypothetical protein